MPRKKTPEKREEILSFIIETIDSSGYPPSIREICEKVNLNSPATVHYHLRELEREGSIRKDPNKKRAMTVNRPERMYAEQIPILGNIAAGVPIFAEENCEEYLPFVRDYGHGGDLFALKIRGDSMCDIGIMDGDYVILEKCTMADNGDIVAALIDDEATLKRYYKEGGHFRLQPENSEMEPIYVDNVQILGKIAAQFRYY